MCHWRSKNLGRREVLEPLLLVKNDEGKETNSLSYILRKKKNALNQIYTILNKKLKISKINLEYII